MGDWVACPHCGERIKRDAKACRHCGSDDRTGWSEAADLDAVDLPEDDDYAQSLEDEGLAPRTRAKASNRLALAAVSLLLILIFAALLLRGLL